MSTSQDSITSCSYTSVFSKAERRDASTLASAPWKEALTFDLTSEVKEVFLVHPYLLLIVLLFVPYEPPSNPSVKIQL